MPFDTQVTCLQGPISPAGPLGGGGGEYFPGCYRLWAIAQLTHLHISIPASGAPPGEVPEECFPRGMPSRGLMDHRHVLFTSGVTVLGGEPPLKPSPDIQIHDPVCPDITEEEDMDSMNAVTDVPIPVLRPQPEFRQFSWPREEWGPDGDPSLFDFSKELPGWCPCGYGRQSMDPPSLPISPILRTSLDDSVIANVGSSREESNTPSETVIATQTAVGVLPIGIDSGPDVLADSPSPDVH